MLKVRLARIGKKQQPNYRIVVTETRTKRNSKSLEIIGHYRPSKLNPTFKIDQKRMAYWLKLGAQPSPSLEKLINQNEKTA